ncbi:MAG: PAS domain S-box protein, partial [Deltaproteobacteria bacterium]|nr:PAS domain S-box protein [Deltaproteobacteria bacterium]
MSFLSKHIRGLWGKQDERAELEEVRRNILDKLLYVFSLLGLPAIGIGAIQAFQQGRWLFSLIYVFFYLLLLLATFATRRFSYRSRGIILVSSMFIAAVAILFRIGMSGIGLQLMLGVCFTVAVLFGFRGGMVAILFSLVSIIYVAIGMTTGFIEIYPEQMLTSTSPMAWITAVLVFFMIVSITIIVPQMFIKRIEASLDLIEEHRRALETRNWELIKGIQEREKAEETVRESEEKFRNLVEATADRIWELGADGKYTYTSPQVRNLLGYEPQEVIGRTPLNFMEPGEADRLKPILVSIGKEKRPFFNLENVNLHKDGHQVILETRGVPRLDPQGNLLGYRGVDRDITDRKRTEEMMVQSEKMLSVGGLAAGMAHEINNPLGVMLQATQNVLRRISSELPVNARVAEECGTTLKTVRAYLEKREVPLFLEDIRQSGERAAEIVSNMLSFSRKAEGGGSSADVADLLDKTVALAASDYDLKKTYDFRQIEIVREYEPDVPPVVCQSSKRQQVFLNMLRNSGEAMQETKGM